MLKHDEFQIAVKVNETVNFDHNNLKKNMLGNFHSFLKQQCTLTKKMAKKQKRKEKKVGKQHIYPKKTKIIKSIIRKKQHTFFFGCSKQI